MQKLEDEVRADIRDMYMSHNHSTAKGVIITNQLRHVAPVIRHYVKYLEDNFRLTQADEGAELVKFSSLYEMLEYVGGKPLSTWQKNNIRRWEESRRKVCPSVLLVVDPVQEETDETAELRKQVAEMKERIEEQEEKYLSRLNELVEAQRKLKRIQLVATTTYGKEDK